MLAEHFHRIGLPSEAVAFLCKLWDAIQFLDDIYDRDETPNVAASIYNVLIALPSDPFFAAHRDALVPAMAVAFHKWQAANHIEEAGITDRLPQSYMWRAGFYDVALTVAALSMPPDRVPAVDILTAYGETLDEYTKEFSDA